MISPLPGVTTLKPGSATFPLPGDRRRSRRRRRRDRCERGGGYLTLTRPWPSMLRGIYGDPERYRETVLEPLRGEVLRGRRRQGRRRRIPVAARPRRRRHERVRAPRVHDRGGVRARRPSRASPRRRSSAPTTPTTGQAIIAFVTLKHGQEVGQRARRGVARARAGKIGAIARPRVVIFTEDLPKTRSGKIMRRLLRDVAEGRDLGDTTTLADPAVVEELRSRAASGAAEE